MSVTSLPILKYVMCFRFGSVLLVKVLLPLFIFSYLWLRKYWEEQNEENTTEVKLDGKIDQGVENSISDK